MKIRWVFFIALIIVGMGIKPEPPYVEPESAQAAQEAPEKPISEKREKPQDDAKTRQKAHKNKSWDEISTAEKIRRNPNGCDLAGGTEVMWADGSCHPSNQASITSDVPTSTPAPSYGGSHRDWLRAAGIAEKDFGYAEYIINHENGLWCPTRWNGQLHCPDVVTDHNPTGGSSAYGICQALPGSKMSSHGSDWQTNPITQLRWCDSYAHSRYGSWAAAYAFWAANSWW